MPKQKSHSGASKRFKITGAGRILRQRAGKRHLLERKPSRLTRRLTGTAELSTPDTKTARRLLGGRAGRAR